MNESVQLAIFILLAGCITGLAAALYNHVRECKFVAEKLADHAARLNAIERVQR